MPVPTEALQALQHRCHQDPTQASSWKLTGLTIRIHLFPGKGKVTVSYFHTESPPPTETASEDEVIFNRILEVNKGNATKALLLLGGDGGRTMFCQNLCKYFSRLTHHHVRDAQRQTHSDCCVAC